MIWLLKGSNHWSFGNLAKDLISFKLCFFKFHVENNLPPCLLHSFSITRILFFFRQLFYEGLPQVQFLNLLSIDAYFLSDQWKETEKNNRMGKTRDLFKKIRDTKGTFHAKMGSIKDRNGLDLTEAEDIKKRWQEYTEELYKKDPHDRDNHDGVITHLEPNILEWEVKLAIGSITTNEASGGDGIPVEILQIWKVML